jgi:molybdenum cofactor synthesis domain-containing protein
MKKPGFEVRAVNISVKKGTVKETVDRIELDARGIVGDAHAGSWHRQVSLLAEESIRKAEKSAGENFPYGTFAENITTEGLDLNKTNILDRFIGGQVELEVTQIGKKCHSKCAIGKKIGDCIMPAEGIFARVVKGGKVEAGDVFEYVPRVFKVAVITLSDRASAGEYKDLSGPKIRRLSEKWFEENRLQCAFEVTVIPDEKELFSKTLEDKIKEGADLIFTTGSTGIGDRDIAPDVILGLIQKEIPGIMEHIRLKYGQVYPNALLSRSVAGIIGKTMIFSMPGSPKAVAEYMEEIHRILFHAFLMLNGINKH